MVPQPGEHVVPPCVTAQLTPALFGSLPTVAANCWVMFTGSRALPGAIEMVMAGTVTVAAAWGMLFAGEVAVMVTVKSLGGGVEGAV